MKILVPCKRVPDPDQKLRLKADGNKFCNMHGHADGRQEYVDDTPSLFFQEEKFCASVLL